MVPRVHFVSLFQLYYMIWRKRPRQLRPSTTALYLLLLWDGTTAGLLNIWFNILHGGFTGIFGDSDHTIGAILAPWCPPLLEESAGMTAPYKTGGLSEVENADGRLERFETIVENHDSCRTVIAPCTRRNKEADTDTSMHLENSGLSTLRSAKRLADEGGEREVKFSSRINRRRLLISSRTSLLESSEVVSQLNKRFRAGYDTTFGRDT
ncbi:hypothetical protein C8R44DRAFT_735136 [Mycena epipterygia]|nr:hypothetical protein C8R44DRAFT_735136 [Mycena epipterygia]